ncbi:MAG: SMC family ATPase, partial [candidate division KSB1 bacterium]|nr:SMC family ATPase [candidate division KSB1 bacterium]
MVIKSLKLQNYRRFRSLELEFPENLIGILGRNGMGKTTIVEAIGWALYGTRSARTDKLDIRSQFASETDVCSAEMVFHCSGQEYRIVRQLRGKNAASEAAIYLNSTGQAEAVHETGVNQYVENLLKLDYRSFFASVFAKQKDLAALSQMMPEERRKSICRLINIDVIDKARQAVRRDKTEQDGLIKGLETRRKNITELKVQQRKLQQQLNENLKKEQESLAWLEDIKKRLEEAKKNLEAISQIRDKHQQLVAEIEKLTTRQTDYARLAQRHQQEIQQIQQARKELETLQTHLVRFSEIKQEKERLDLESIKQAALDAKNQEKERLSGLLKRNTVQLTKLEVDLNALATVRPQLEQVNQQLVRLEAEQTKLRTRKEEIHGQLEAVKSLGLEVKEKKDKVTALGAKGPCPVCTRPLGEQYAHVVTHLEEELKKLRSQYTQFSQQEKDAEQQLITLEQSLKSAREKRDQLLQAGQKYEHLLSQKKEITESIEDLQKQLRNLNQEIAQIGPLKYDAQQHEL